MLIVIYTKATSIPKVPVTNSQLPAHILLLPRRYQLSLQTDCIEIIRIVKISHWTPVLWAHPFIQKYYMSRVKNTVDRGSHADASLIPYTHKKSSVPEDASCCVRREGGRKNGVNFLVFNWGNSVSLEICNTVRVRAEFLNSAYTCPCLRAFWWQC